MATAANLIDHYKAVRARMGMAPPPAVVRRLAAPAPIILTAPVPARSLATYSGRPVSIVGVQYVVAEYFGVTRDDLVGKSQKRRITFARQIAMYLCRKLTSRTLPQIAAQFRRDHSTVFHAVRAIERMLELQERVMEAVCDLTLSLTGKWPVTYWGA